MSKDDSGETKAEERERQDYSRPFIRYPFWLRPKATLCFTLFLPKKLEFLR